MTVQEPTVFESQKLFASDSFVKDAPWPVAPRLGEIECASRRIDGLRVEKLLPNADPRGILFELLTTRDGPIDPINHAYSVVAEAGSERALVYHAQQSDRLHFVQGRFRIILVDIREDSRTFGARLSFEAGAHAPLRVTIPPFVAHGVKNAGNTSAMFVNLPTRPFYRDNPDKFRFKPTKTLQLMDFEGPLDF